MPDNNFNYTDDPIIGGEVQYLDDAKTQVDKDNPITPSNATRINWNTHFQSIRGALKLISHSILGYGGYREGGRRDLASGPLGKSAFVHFTSMSGNTIYVAEDTNMEDLVFVDWPYLDPNYDPLIPLNQQQLHPLHGKMKHSKIMAFDWIEVDARTGDGWISPEGEPGRLVLPGWCALIRNVDYDARTLTTWEENLPERTDVYAWLWRIVEEAESYNLSMPPIFNVSGGYVKSDTTLNINTEVCAWNKFCGHSLFGSERKFQDGKQLQDCILCAKTDVLNRLDRGSPYNEEENPIGAASTSPFSVFPDARLREAGIVNEETLQFCNGRDEEGNRICSEFVPQAAPDQSVDPVSTKLLDVMDGIMVAGIIPEGSIYPVFYWLSPPSMNIFGGWAPTTLGGWPGAPAIHWLIHNETGFVDDRESDGSGGLTGSLRGMLHRPWQGDKEDSACFRFLGNTRIHMRSAEMQYLEDDYSCNFSAGPARQMYSGSLIFGMFNQILNKTYHYRGNRAGRIWPVTSEKNIALPGTAYPWFIHQRHRSAKVSITPTDIDVSGNMIFEYLYGESMIKHAVGKKMDYWVDAHIPETKANVGSFWFDSCRTLAEVWDAIYFPNESSIPLDLRGQAFIISNVAWHIDSYQSNGWPLEGHDTITLLNHDGSNLDLSQYWEDLQGKSFSVFSNLTFFVPTHSYRVTRGGIIVDATYYPAGRDMDDDDIPETHVIVDESVPTGNYEVSADYAMEVVNRIDATDIQELRTMTNKANTMQITTLAGSVFVLAAGKSLIWQKGGPNACYWYTGLPDGEEYPDGHGWVPTVINDLQALPFSLEDSEVSYIGVDYIVERRQQTKTANVMIFELNSIPNLPNADCVDEAYIYVKATPLSESNNGTGKIAMGLVRKLHGDEKACILHQTFGNCPGFWDAPYSCGGLHARNADEGHWPWQDPYPNGDDPVNSYESFAPITNCSKACGYRSDLYNSFNPQPEGYNSEYISNPKWWSKSIYLDGESSPQFRDIVDPTERNTIIDPEDPFPDHKILACLINKHQVSSLSKWSAIIRRTEGVLANGQYHRLDLTPLIRQILIEGKTGVWGLAGSSDEGIGLGLNGDTGDWTGYHIEYGPNHPEGDPGGDDENDLEPRYDAPTNSITVDREEELGGPFYIVNNLYDIAIAGPLVVKFHLNITAPGVPTMNLPGGEYA